MIFYTLKDLTLRLKKELLPASRIYLNALEKAGVIFKPSNSVHFRTKDASDIALSEMRIYTEEEISRIVELIRAYQNK